MVVSVALSVTFPLVFVAQRARRLPLVALAVLVVHVPIAFLGQAVAGLWGLSIALAVSTALALACMLVLLDALRATVGDLLRATVVVGAIAAMSSRSAPGYSAPPLRRCSPSSSTRERSSRSAHRASCAPGAYLRALR